MNIVKTRPRLDWDSIRSSPRDGSYKVLRDFGFRDYGLTIMF